MISRPTGLLIAFLCTFNFPVIASVYSCDTSWTKRESGTTENLKEVKWDGQQFIAFANSESASLESEDGTHWSKKSQGDEGLGSGSGAYLQTKLGGADQEANFLNGAVFANDVWVTFLDTRLYTSKDKKVWKLQDAFAKDEEEYDGGSEELHAGITSARSEMRWIKFDHHKAIISSDGEHWHETHELSRPFWWRMGVAILRVIKNHFVAITYFGSTNLSQDGYIWQEGGSTNRPGSVASNGELLVLISWYGGIEISKDAGKSWIVVKSDVVDKEASERQYIGDVIWNKQKFIIAQGLDGILYSTDGNAWQKNTLNISVPMATSFGSITTANSAWNGESLVSVGNAGSIYTTACHPDPQAGGTESPKVDATTIYDGFVKIPGGCFNRIDDTNKNLASQQICVKDFWMGKYEVTQNEWANTMQSNPSFFKKGNDFPVENVSYPDILKYIDKINKFRSDHKFRIPTEAEWEFACTSGGHAETYAGSQDANQVAWYDANSQHSTHAIGRKMPNGLGLYDMSGNVEEWVSDSLEPKISNANQHIIRGGAWSYKEKFISCNRRGYGADSSREKNLGFRLVLD